MRGDCSLWKISIYDNDNKITFPKYELINLLPLLNGILFSLW